MKHLEIISPKNLEILSPAGNFASLKSAIYNGADAVYLGLNSFSARGNIENFTHENLKAAVDFAHLYSVKVYLTLNTLIKDSEFDDVLKSVKAALEAGVDAFIVQDIGLCYFLRQNFPNIELHASTQMGIQNIEGVNAIEPLGFSRVVLARETPLSEIRRIKENSSIEIEYFVQGALCVAYSGNCYLCSLLAGSSGNRGKCKQFCRLKYSLFSDTQNRQGYLLSTKDFCMLPKLKQLALNGVTSFKIEGRARRESYVAVATNIYRKAVDNDFKYTNEDIRSLMKVYNRGNFISGYFADENIIYPYAQNHIGIKIGRVINFKKGKKFNEVTIETNHKLKRGDVVKFFVNNIEQGIITLVDIKKLSDNTYLVSTTANLPNSSEVRLVVDSEFENKYLNNVKKIGVDAYLSAHINQKVKLELSFKDISVTIESEYLAPQAKTLSLTYNDAFAQLSKMGENFTLKSLKLDVENVFLTKSELNELRRIGIEKLKNKIIENYNKINKIAEKSKYIQKNIEIIDKKTKNKDILIFDDFNKLNNIHNLNEFLLIYASYDFNENIIKNLYDKHQNLNIYLSLPVLVNENELKKLKNIIFYCQNWGIVANNYYALDLCDRSKIILGSNMNVFNSYAVKYYAEQGYKEIILSKEDFDIETIKNSDINLYCMSNYRPEYMYFRHCPYKEFLQSRCDKCKANFPDLTYKLNNQKFILKRQKIITCQFILKASNTITRNVPNTINKVIEL